MGDVADIMVAKKQGALWLMREGKGPRTDGKKTRARAEEAEQGIPNQAAIR
jgi:hypothetical protein